MKKIYLYLCLTLFLISCSNSKNENNIIQDEKIESKISKKLNLNINNYYKTKFDFNGNDKIDYIYTNDENIYFIDDGINIIEHNINFKNIDGENYKISKNNPVEINENLIMINIEATNNDNIIISKYKVLAQYIPNEKKIIAFKYIPSRKEIMDSKFNKQIIGVIKKINSKNEFYYLSTNIVADKENYILSQNRNESFYLKFNNNTKKYDIEDDKLIIDKQNISIYDAEKEILIGKNFANMFIESVLVYSNDSFSNNEGTFHTILKGNLTTNLKINYIKNNEENSFYIAIEFLDYNKFENNLITINCYSEYLKNIYGPIEVKIPQFLYLTNDVDLNLFKDLMPDEFYNKFKDGTTLELDVEIDEILIGGWYNSEAFDKINIKKINNIKEYK